MQYGDGDAVKVDLSKYFNADPAVGVLLVDAELRIHFINRRSAELFAPVDGKMTIGASLWDLFPESWARERERIYQKALAEHRTLVIRHIRRGKRIQSTCHLIYGEEDDPQALLVFTVAGETEVPEDDSELEVIESGVVDLGPLDRLTRRELEVLALVGHGMGREQIARTLYRSPKTVDNHMAAISAKLGSANRAELVKIASTAGLRVEHADLPRTHE